MKFLATILDGHKGAALEFPDDPAKAFGTKAVKLWDGRRGHKVVAVAHGVTFESAIVPRMNRQWLLLPAEALQDIGADIGDEIEIELSAPA